MENSSRFKKGHIPWIKGLTKETNPILAEISRKNSLKHGKETSMFGRKHSEETKLKMREARLKNPISAFKGRKRPDMRERFMQEKNPNWQGGKSFEPYTSEFNIILKESIRNRDGNRCQLCGVPQIECLRRLAVHHIDYNKKNNNSRNLISLCDKCHCGTNKKDRTYWENYFKKEMVKIK